MTLQVKLERPEDLDPKKFFGCFANVPPSVFPIMKIINTKEHTYYKFIYPLEDRIETIQVHLPVLFKETKVEPQEIVDEKKHLPRGKIRPEEVFEEELENADENDYEANYTLVRLADMIKLANQKIKEFVAPQFNGEIVHDFGLEKTNKYFLEFGAKQIATSIVTLIEGLVKYAKYQRDTFGNDNQYLKITLRSYRKIYDDLLSEKTDKIVDKLQELVACAEVVVIQVPEQMYAVIMEPVTSILPSTIENEESAEGLS